jgi:hypothetical protein
MNGRVWGPPSPPWKQISSSKAQPFVEDRVVEAADHDVGDVGEAIGAQQVARRPRGEVAQRILALDAVLVEVTCPVRAKHNRAVFGRAHEQPANMRMLAQRSGQLWMALIDLLEREPAAFLHQVDESEVAGAQDNDVAAGDVGPVAFLGFGSGRLIDGVMCHRRLLVASRETGHAVPSRSDRSTSSSSPYPWRCLNVAPWVWSVV